MAKTKEWSNKGLRVEVDNDDAEFIEKTTGNPKSSSSFKLIRKLVNFEVRVGNDNPSVPITFVACYTAADASAAGEANKLKLAMWDEDREDWKNIPITRAVDCPDGFSGYAGAFEAKITSRWPDPWVAWGGG